MLILQDITKSHGSHTLFQGLNLQVARGETVAITGVSGSGKTSLLRLVAGLDQEYRGSVQFDGHTIDHLAPERRAMAFMFQDFALFPHLSPIDNVCFGLIEQGVKKAAARTAARELLERFGLQGQAERSIAHLSGGEKQRVALARALITKPRVLLLDEPFSALDPDRRSDLREEFALRIREQAMATLLVTHDLHEARQLAQRVYRLHNGRLEEI